MEYVDTEYIDMGTIYIDIYIDRYIYIALESKRFVLQLHCDWYISLLPTDHFVAVIILALPLSPPLRVSMEIGNGHSLDKA